MSKADTLLTKASAFEKLALYSDRKAFLQALSQGLTPEYKQFYNLDEFGNPIHTGIPPVPPEEPEERMFMQREYADKPGAANRVPTEPVLPIDRTVQEALNTLNAQDPFMIAPLTPDGWRGPETNKALQSFKGRYMKNQPNASINDIINAVRAKEANFRLKTK